MFFCVDTVANVGHSINRISVYFFCLRVLDADLFLLRREPAFLNDGIYDATLAMSALLFAALNSASDC